MLTENRLNIRPGKQAIFRIIGIVRYWRSGAHFLLVRLVFLDVFFRFPPIAGAGVCIDAALSTAIFSFPRFVESKDILSGDILLTV